MMKKRITKLNLTVAMALLIFVLNSTTTFASDNVTIGISYTSTPGNYVTSVEKAGAIAKVFPLISSQSEADKLLDGVDALVMTGGADINPKHYGEEPSEKLGTVNNKRDTSDILLLKEALKRDIPVLAICRNMQMLNVVQGGTLHQDIPSEIETDIVHRGSSEMARHKITIYDGSKLSKLFSDNKVTVNSYHHQCVEKLGKDLVVTARAEDDIIEGIELKNKTYVIGVQFHPEKHVVLENDAQLKVFEELGKEALKYRGSVLSALKAPSSVDTSLYGHDDVKVSWKKVENADGYAIYYKKSTSSSYTFLKTTTALSVKKANLTDGVKYSFKVVPCVKRGTKWYKSEKAKIDTINTLKKVDKPRVSKDSKNYVKLTFKDINGERGYQISRSTKQTGTNIITTRVTNGQNYRVLKTTRNKTYYYKIRAYVGVGDNRVYGPWSETTKYVLK